MIKTNHKLHTLHTLHIFSASSEFKNRGLTTWDAMRRKAIYSYLKV